MIAKPSVQQRRDLLFKPREDGSLDGRSVVAWSYRFTDPTAIRHAVGSVNPFRFGLHSPCGKGKSKNHYFHHGDTSAEYRRVSALACSAWPSLAATQDIASRMSSRPQHAYMLTAKALRELRTMAEAEVLNVDAAFQ
jgi:hypothetical protein